MHFWLACGYACCLFSVRYRCIWGRCGRCGRCGVSWHPLHYTNVYSLVENAPVLVLILNRHWSLIDWTSLCLMKTGLRSIRHEPSALSIQIQTVVARPVWLLTAPVNTGPHRARTGGCRQLGEKPVGRKTFGRIIFWVTDDWATAVISKKTFRRKTVRRQRPKQFAFLLVLPA